MSDQPPFQPPNQPPYQPSQPQQPSYAAPTQVPGQTPWAQQPPSYPQQQPYQSGGYGGGPGAPGTPSGGGQKKPWGLVVGALVAGLVIGGGAAAGIVAATTGDPKDSDEYKAVSRDLDEARESLSGGDDPTAEAPDSPTTESVAPPTDPESSESAPSGGEGTREIDGWSVTEPELSEDSLGDFEATMQATNNTGGPEVGYFEITVSQGSRELATLTCINRDGEPVDEGTTVEIECFTSDDYTADYDTVDIEAGF